MLHTNRRSLTLKIDSKSFAILSFKLVQVSFSVLVLVIENNEVDAEFRYVESA